MPILFVFHGTNRSASSYLNAWIPLARTRKFVVITPEFTDELYPSNGDSNDYYNLGGVIVNKVIQPEENWTFSIIEPIFDFVRSDIGSRQRVYDIYGHSAGSQFVHRFLLFKEESRVRRAVAANAGWYTIPDDNIDFPYGLKNSPQKQKGLQVFFAKEAYILLGTADTDPNDSDLRKTKEALLQGPHRYARGYYFMNELKKISAKEKFTLNWKIVEVEGARHSNGQMAPAAADILYKDIETE
jgi:hypothetical protein